MEKGDTYYSYTYVGYIVFVYIVLGVPARCLFFHLVPFLSFLSFHMLLLIVQYVKCETENQYYSLSK